MNHHRHHLWEVGWVSLRLGLTGFGGIAGMVGMIEDEVVARRGWVDKKHYLDVVGAANIIPGPNSVEIIMHCGRARAGTAGLVLGGIAYILPATIICLIWAYLYTMFGHLPTVAPFLFGIRPATVAIIAGAVYRLSGGVFKDSLIIVLSLFVLAGALCGINEVVLLLGAGVLGALYSNRKSLYTIAPPVLLASPYSNSKLFFIFLKIGAILYGSGYVLFAYLDDALVQRNHWLTGRQLTDAISAGQITPGPILSSATFAGYLISGIPGALLATLAIFLPSFFIAFFLHHILAFINRHKPLRQFLNIVNAASVALIAAVAIHMLPEVITVWRTAFILAICLIAIFFTRISNVWLILFSSLAGYILLLI